ncbi:facilitated trehalose transporter Tret1-like isoform X1 [Leptopilina heterotoma]|uniref:facilitated trehalose transporter Tret1-like isoform X1 n=1 Tax=Leptopilina heterotoma TaxID=63436 RepID=UPI001CA7FEAE|nr:facilitated trehalose transporter Tret1-like isoform X1 [Leptopilina heterotoma]
MVSKRKLCFLQYTSAISASMTSLGLASAVAWSSPALPYFHTQSNFTKTEIYWIVPLLSVGCALGFLLNPLIINRLGRKKSLLLYSVPQLLSWLLLIFSKNNIIIIYLGRILAGIGYGAGACALTFYLSEIGNRENRGIFMVLFKLTMSIGSFLTVLIGAYCSHNTLNIFLLMLPITFLVTFIFMPDSTYFLSQNQETEIRIDFLNGKNDFSKLEKLIQPNLKIQALEESEKRIETNLKTSDAWEQVETNLKNADNCKQMETNLKNKTEEHDENTSGLKKLFTIPSNRRALLITIACAAQNVFSGYGITKYFAQNILTYDESLLPAKDAVFLLAAISILSSASSTFTIEKFKRRTLLLTLGCLASFSIGIVGVFFYLKTNMNIKNFDWLPLVGLVIFDFSLTNGNYNIYLIYQGELFPSDVKSVGITFTKVTLMFFTFTASIVYQLLNDIFDISMIFGIFATFCLFQTFVIYKIAPETKGKSLDEIQQLLRSKTRN